MRIRLLAFVAAAATAVAATQVALAATATTSQDVRVATAACASLRTSVGALTFSRAYSGLAGCVQQWVPAVPQARVDATWACAARRQGAGCVAARTQAAMIRRLSRTAPFLAHCSAELNLLGTNAFTARYGGSSVNAAFSSCAAPKSIEAVVPAGAGTATYPLTFTASQENASGVSGVGFVQVQANDLSLSTSLFGLDTAQLHSLLLLSPGSACPTTSQVDDDGAIAMTPDSVLITLDQPQQVGVPRSVALDGLLAAPLAGRTVVVLGATLPNGTYDKAYPVACGSLTAS